MSRGWFITATDTGAGKTRAALALMRSLIGAGYRVAGMKPVASGCESTVHGLRNADAVALQQASNVDVSYEDVNPYCLPLAIAPHLAAQRAGAVLSLARIETSYHRIAAVSDFIVVEGVGGWRVPLAVDFGLTELTRALGLPVILVVGLRLGCLNHAGLTFEALRADGMEVTGWIANRIDPDMEAMNENIIALEELIKAPHLATLPHDAGNEGSPMPGGLLEVLTGAA